MTTTILTILAVAAVVTVAWLAEVALIEQREVSCKCGRARRTITIVEVADAQRLADLLTEDCSICRTAMRTTVWCKCHSAVARDILIVDAVDRQRTVEILTEACPICREARRPWQQSAICNLQSAIETEARNV